MQCSQFLILTKASWRNFAIKGGMSIFHILRVFSMGHDLFSELDSTFPSFASNISVVLASFTLNCEYVVAETISYLKCAIHFVSNFSWTSPPILVPNKYYKSSYIWYLIPKKVIKVKFEHWYHFLYCIHTWYHWKTCTFPCTSMSHLEWRSNHKMRVQVKVKCCKNASFLSSGNSSFVWRMDCVFADVFGNS